MHEIIRCIAGFISGYLYIKWLEIPVPFSAGEFIAGVILEPFKFFAAAIAFLAGFLFYAILLRELFLTVLQWTKNIQTAKWKILIYFGVILSLGILYTAGKWQTLVLFCFSCMYGMISIDIKSLHKKRLSG
ncbi:hypothetical protein [Peribacillus kribbensis]|uniref:hypothetical protein n=1 Tax=Peribacillus kribbensis TaxID=356658 RepID=UPI0004283B1E|nr:hypothetical protein [Peribacillus kribbensis]